MNNLNELLENLFDDQPNDPRCESIMQSNRRIDQAKQSHEFAKQIQRDNQEMKRITAEQRTAILKMLNEGNASLNEVATLCIECIATTVNDKAFKNQALMKLDEHYSD